MPYSPSMHPFIAREHHPQSIMLDLGHKEKTCKEKEINYRVFRQPFEHDDRVTTEGITYGKVKILTTPLGKLLGAHILRPRAGELINEVVSTKRKK